MAETAFKDLVDELPEPMTCPRRAENGMDRDNGPFKNSGNGLDRWQKFKSNGDRVCSYCGSLHPEDFFALVKACAETDAEVPYETATRIEPSDKGYKVYVHRPGVHNAHDGGIKFYKQHIPRAGDGKLILPEGADLYFSCAVVNSRERFDKFLDGRRAN
jgi:hypothetical protein